MFIDETKFIYKEAVKSVNMPFVAIFLKSACNANKLQRYTCYFCFMATEGMLTFFCTIM